MNHVVVEESQHGKALQYCGVVPAAVLLELPGFKMEGQPVNLHDEEPLQQEVNTADAIDPHLGFGKNACVPEEHPGQGLQEGIRAPVNLGHYIPRFAAPGSVQVGEQVWRINVSAVIRTLHHHQGLEFRQAQQGMKQDIRLQASDGGAAASSRYGG